MLFILTETERPLNILLSLSMAFADKAHRAEEQFRRLKPTLNKTKVSKISIWHAYAKIFQKGRPIF